MLIDFHTHYIPTESIHAFVYSVDIQNPIFNLPKFFTLGIPPWYIQENWKEKISLFGDIVQKYKVLAIGEFGLDRFKGPDLEIQEKVFYSMVQKAKDLQLPCVIHCVRCFEKLIFLYKKIKPKTTWIVHGFTGNKTIAVELWKKGIFTSFGEGLKKFPHCKEIFYISPEELIFLETDESKISIKEIYEIASKIKGIPQEKLEKIIINNFINLFGNVL